MKKYIDKIISWFNKIDVIESKEHTKFYNELNTQYANKDTIKQYANSYFDSLSRNVALPMADTYLIFLKRYNLNQTDLSIKLFNAWLREYCEDNEIEYSSKTQKINYKIERYHLLITENLINNLLLNRLCSMDI